MRRTLNGWVRSQSFVDSEMPFSRKSTYYCICAILFTKFLKIVIFSFFQKAVSCESEELRARAISYQNGMIDANQLHNEAVQIPKLQVDVEMYKSKLSQVGIFLL